MSNNTWAEEKSKIGIIGRIEIIIKKKKVLASFKPPNWQRRARHVRRGKGRVRTQDLGHRSGARCQLHYSPRCIHCNLSVSRSVEHGWWELRVNTTEMSQKTINLDAELVV